MDLYTYWLMEKATKEELFEKIAFSGPAWQRPFRSAIAKRLKLLKRLDGVSGANSWTIKKRRGDFPLSDEAKKIFRIDDYGHSKWSPQSDGLGDRPQDLIKRTYMGKVLREKNAPIRDAIKNFEGAINKVQSRRDAIADAMREKRNLKNRLAERSVRDNKAKLLRETKDLDYIVRSSADAGIRS